MNRAPIRSAVSSSWQFMENPPSPTAARTGASGRASLAPIAALKPYAIPERPLDIQKVSGRRLGQNWPKRYLWDPTSVVTMVSGGRTDARPLTRSPGHMVSAEFERLLNIAWRLAWKSANAPRHPLG